VKTRYSPKALTLRLLTRSPCSVSVAAVIVDAKGIVAYGWNHIGPTGFGAHAEREAIRRANKKRLEGARIYVAATRNRTRRPVLARPCVACLPLMRKYGLEIVYRNQEGRWVVE
jgi:tRNA(Arg) A34 adenosine deaminase TadA